MTDLELIEQYENKLKALSEAKRITKTKTNRNNKKTC